MSDFIHKEGSGSMFPQQKKTDKSPDFKGEIMIAGNIYELAGWNKQGANKAYISLSAQVKGSFKTSKPDAPAKTESKPNLPKNAVGFPDPFDNDLPF
jgi:hypothetical protein